jgi:hypothetical protein
MTFAAAVVVGSMWFLSKMFLRLASTTLAVHTFLDLVSAVNNAPKFVASSSSFR